MLWLFIQSFIRHALTSAGAIVVAKGLADQSSMTDAIGAVMVLIGFGHSLWQKWQAQKSPETRNSPGSNAGSFLLAIGLLLGLACAPAGAQGSTNAMPGLSPIPLDQSSPWGRLGNDLWAIGSNLYPFTTNGQATVTMGYGINTASKHQIEALQIAVPMSQMVSITAVGAHIGSDWLYGGGTLTLSTTKYVPLLHTIYISIGDGAVKNFKSGEMANYVCNEYDKCWTPWRNCYLHAGVAIANVSNIPGLNVIGGGGVTVLW